MVYKINKKKKIIKILDQEFVKNNKENWKLLVNEKEYDICEHVECVKYDKNVSNENDDV